MKVQGVSNAIIKNNLILLIKREHDPFKGLLCFPGGTVEAGETYIEATIRETMEETGIVMFNHIGYKVSFPKHHLLKITNMGKYEIVTSLSQPIGEIKEMKFVFSGVECKWYGYDEAMGLNENLFVPNIKANIVDAFELLKLNRLI
jgi:8-oxo-dGTP pyrophosphatase MutT (NUDIX family)